MRTISISILEYLGKVENGILVLIGVVHDKVYYEATFFYTEKDMILTISDDLEEVIGDIKFHPEYSQILSELMKKVVPFDQLFDSIDPVNFARWVEVDFESEEQNSPEYISPSEIKNID
jgi:choline kinase